MSTEERVKTVKVIVCDFCKKEISHKTSHFICVVCGKDLCNPCRLAVEGDDTDCEDGTLCDPCGKLYAFTTDGEGLGVYDRKTNQGVAAPYL